MKAPLNSILAISVAFALVGCNKPAGSNAGSLKPYRETSFDDVTRQLDPGGTIYGYLATDQWMAGLSTNILKLGELADMIPGQQEIQREHLHRVVGTLARVVQKSGVESLSGVGVSGIQVSPELFRTKLILHHKKGEGEGLFWNVMGSKAHALDGLDLLTDDTALAAFGDLDVPLLWKTIQDEVKSAGVPELSDAVAGWPAQFEALTKMNWEKFLDSLGGELGLVLTLNEANMVAVPFTEGFKVPEPGLLLAIKVKDDLLYQRISSEMEKSGMARMTDEKGLKMAAIRLPIPVPLDLELAVARSGDYLFIASSSIMVRNALAVQSGKESGLRKREDFAALMKFLPSEGNYFVYADRSLSGTIQAVQKAVLAQKDPDAARSPIIQKLLTQKPTFGIAIGRRTATGWESVSVGNQDSATALVAAPAIGGVAVVSAVALPALARAKAKAEELHSGSTGTTTD